MTTRRAILPDSRAPYPSPPGMFGQGINEGIGKNGSGIPNCNLRPRLHQPLSLPPPTHGHPEVQHLTSEPEASPSAIMASVGFRRSSFVTEAGTTRNFSASELGDVAVFQFAAETERVRQARERAAECKRLEEARNSYAQFSMPTPPSSQPNIRIANDVKAIQPLPSSQSRLSRRFASPESFTSFAGHQDRPNHITATSSTHQAWAA